MKKQEVVVIVGGSSGLGGEMVDILLKRGFAVVVVSRERKDLPKEVIHLSCDICDEKNRSETIALIKKAYDKIDYFVMAVGGIRDDVNDEYELNYLAPIKLIKALLELVDHFLVISSLSAKDPYNYRFKKGGYSLAKHDLSQWARGLERATLVESGFFNSGLLKEIEDPFFPADVEDVAKKAVKAMLQKKKHSYLSGFTFILGVLSPRLPKSAVRMTDFLLVQIYRLSLKIGD